MSIYDICSCGHARGVHLVGDPSTGSCDLRNCYCRRFSSTPSMTEQLEAAKLREAELRNALVIVRTELEPVAARICHHSVFGTCIDVIASGKTLHYTRQPFPCEVCRAQQILAKIESLSVALAERDRAIEKRTAERCAEIVRTVHMPIKSSDWAGILNAVALKISEFNLEPKPEGE